MTFDFPPGWLEASRSATALTGTMRPAPVPAPAGTPDLAAVVKDLFAEGTLSWRQLRELARMPELEGLLDDAVAGASLGRRGERQG